MQAVLYLRMLALQGNRRVSADTDSQSLGRSGRPVRGVAAAVRGLVVAAIPVRLLIQRAIRVAGNQPFCVCFK